MVVWDSIGFDCQNLIFQFLFESNTKRESVIGASENLYKEDKGNLYDTDQEEKEWMNVRRVSRRFRTLADRNFDFKGHLALERATHRRAKLSLLLIFSLVEPSNLDNSVFLSFVTHIWAIDKKKNKKICDLYVENGRVNGSIVKNYNQAVKYLFARSADDVFKLTVMIPGFFLVLFGPPIIIGIFQIVFLRRNFDKPCDKPLQIYLIVSIILGVFWSIFYLEVLRRRWDKFQKTFNFLFYLLIAAMLVFMGWASVGAAWIHQSQTCASTAPDLFKMSKAAVILTFTVSLIQLIFAFFVGRIFFLVRCCSNLMFDPEGMVWATNEWGSEQDLL